MFRLCCAISKARRYWSADGSCMTKMRTLGYKVWPLSLRFSSITIPYTYLQPITTQEMQTIALLLLFTGFPLASAECGVSDSFLDTECNHQSKTLTAYNSCTDCVHGQTSSDYVKTSGMTGYGVTWILFCRLSDLANPCSSQCSGAETCYTCDHACQGKNPN